MTMRSMLIIGAIVAIFTITGCEEDKTVRVGGRVAHIDLEGGFYGIYGDDGVGYDPDNLPAEFQQDSLRVLFGATILTEQASTRMWGKRVHLTSIERLK